MGLFDSLWDISEQQRIGDIRAQLDLLRVELDLLKHDFNASQLASENLELKLMAGSLIRLLISKRVITPQEYAEVAAETNPAADGESSGAPKSSS